MRYQVPQFVDIEDKIIGPLTLKQFLIYFSTALLLIPVYLFTDLSLFITLALPMLGVAAAFAHLKPGGKSLFEFLMNAVGFASKGRVWLWRRESRLRLLPVRGVELPEAQFEDEPIGPGLQEKVRAMETAGNVSREDVADPLVAESTVDKAQNTNKAQ